ncbi:Zinc transporter, ZIP family [Rhodopirellula islandica]|uniref:Zinc transporter, ZIP family n=1 Tax=Rhodopirellula islandica TaxID=595434 RepID=A0A0J1BHV7_RHOIS|nr:ZIP family metal transporter [Rhodopirellula islandica]KLU06068.1 Zinc transporter, ZIP family [Rhodopirellula islandica]
MPAHWLLLVYCVFVLAASMAGGRLSSLLRMTHLRTQLLMSGVGGLMLGIALLHLLPHATEVLNSPTKACRGALIGLLVMFLTIRLFHTHDHGVPVESDGTNSECDHGHDHHHSEKGISWFGLFFGLALHTLVDGVALASSVLIDAEHGAWLGLAGLGTFLAVALHKPLDAFAITSVMNKQKWSVSAQNIANAAFSLACPIGAAAFYFGAMKFDANNAFLGWGLAISAGFFLGIALADLLPEVAFHDHDRVKLTMAFLFGVAIAVGIENLPGHSHEHHPAGGQVEHGHEDHGHEDHGHDHDHSVHDHDHDH